eukprot:767965-Hanusia_phi.AAC.5
MVETIRTKVAASQSFFALTSLADQAQSLTGKNVNKPTAFGLTVHPDRWQQTLTRAMQVFIVNVIGSFAYLGFGLLIATRVSFLHADHTPWLTPDRLLECRCSGPWQPSNKSKDGEETKR